VSIGNDTFNLLTQCVLPTDRLIAGIFVTRRSFEANENQFALWNPKRLPTEMAARRVVIAHQEEVIGESFVLLLGLKGLAAQYAADLRAVDALLHNWHPQALLIDTRLDIDAGYPAFCALNGSPAQSNTLLIAMSSFLPEDDIGALQAAGFDGHFRRPCPMWRMADVLECFYAPRALS
jgi:CheY-like chemotaxis protein